MPDVENDRTCARSDCQRPADRVTVWRSQSGRMWERAECARHLNPAPPLAGFALVEIERATSLGSGQASDGAGG